MSTAALETVALGVLLALAPFVPAGRLWWRMAWAVLVFHAAFSVAGFLSCRRWW